MKSLTWYVSYIVHTLLTRSYTVLDLIVGALIWRFPWVEFMIFWLVWVVISQALQYWYSKMSAPFDEEKT
jgi:hypothetical protein